MEDTLEEIEKGLSTFLQALSRKRAAGNALRNQAARLEALKREIKEHERASQMVTTVRNIPIDRVRDKLQQTK